MAASDKPYRDQNALDIVFAVSSVLMLVSVIWMFVQDYNREFKTEQRVFRDVESAIAQRVALTQLPTLQEFNAAESNYREAKAIRESKSEELKKLRAEKGKIQPLREKAEMKYQAEKAELDSQVSFLDLAYDYNDGAEVRRLRYLIDGVKVVNGVETVEAKDYLRKRVAEAQAGRDKLEGELKAVQEKIDRIESPFTEAESAWKKVDDKFEGQVQVSINKKWGLGDTIRNIPILDGFAAPVKIHQFTLNDVPIDYNFKQVTRFDRCNSCHVGIDRPAYTKEMLESLRVQDKLAKTEDQLSAVTAKLTAAEKVAAEAKKDEDKAEAKQRVETLTQEKTELTATRDRLKKQYTSEFQKLAEARQLLERRNEALQGTAAGKLVPSSEALQLTNLSADRLTDMRVKEFCAHPRLDLFVGANSKHPAEKFGCSSCHGGQGSGTSFVYASHAPNSTAQKNKWIKEHNWESIHFWDFPMSPHRFVESQCLKCHHQVTDLYGEKSRNEAPKLLRGYNLIRENGCFGCHEIAGRKGGRQIGPDMRLEPYPPLDDLTAAEKAKALSDPETQPGNYRKVGPSLFRLSEKTNADWTVKWLRSPRDFRPDTKMPHFYGLSNNHPDVLPSDQQRFPDAEMHAVTYYLFEASNAYLKQVGDRSKDSEAERQKDQALLTGLESKAKLSDAERRELDAVKQRIKLRNVTTLVDLAGGYKGDATKGRQLFSEKGCLACHSHKSTETPQGTPGKADYAPSIHGEAIFGPNLSQLREKLGKAPGDADSARVWLVQWILNPHVYSPRSRMPVTHLTPAQAADVAAWLLEQKADGTNGPNWDKLTVETPKVPVLKKLAEVYVRRLMSKTNMDAFLDGNLEELPSSLIADLPKEEQELAETFKKAGGVDENGLKFYLGKKAVGRLGCYACHDVPGFENAKPIGVGLNDWGKKDPERLAFEDIASFIVTNYNIVPSLTNAQGDPAPVKVEMVDNGKGGKFAFKKMPYEQFFSDMLMGHLRTREGYLHQKILDPRSYDTNRERAWDDRSRMPQFRFSRIRQKAEESDAEYEARAWLEEAKDREAVMTFILGLVADPLPVKSINEPTGDRLMEVKGRQILDKYNCGGCHLIQPGIFEFKPTAKSIALLDSSNNPVDYDYFYHYNWAGKTQPTGEKTQGQGVRYNILENEDAEDEADKNWFTVRLSHALRYSSEKFKGPRDLLAGRDIRVMAKDLVYPPAHVVQNKEALQTFLRDQGPLGGAFTDQLVEYLIDLRSRTNDIYKREPDGDNANARIASPPILVGQGERTQADWLHSFLLDPQPVRRMSVLRMPKFNMNSDEAKMLVDYFAAVERLQNPGTPLPYPSQQIPQHESFDSPYWKAKNKEYVARLKATKDASGKTLFEQRVKNLEPLWAQMSKNLEAQVETAKENVAQATKAYDKSKKAAEAAKKEVDDAKDPEAKKKAEAKLKPLDEVAKEDDRVKSTWDSALAQASASLKDSSAETLKKRWEESEAYIHDAYRMVANRQLCQQCHQIGKLEPGQKLSEGPPLDQVHGRLRPGWAERWIASPQRFLTYKSVMPQNFPPDTKDPSQAYFAGSIAEQLTASRDLILAHPQAAALPINQLWSMPSLQAVKTPAPEKKEPEKKEPEKKEPEKK